MPRFTQNQSTTGRMACVPENGRSVVMQRSFALSGLGSSKLCSHMPQSIPPVTGRRLLWGMMQADGD